MHISEKAHKEILHAIRKANEIKPYIRIEVNFVGKDKRVISTKFTNELYVDSKNDTVEKHEGYIIVMRNEVCNILSNATLDVKNGSITVVWNVQ
jgi:Fe-S cluster assembly iron-binding protein IscA